QKGGSQIGQAYQVVDYATAGHLSPAHGQRHTGTKVVQVALAVREAGRAVVATNHNQGILQFANFVQPLDEQAQGGVEGGNLTKIIGQILANLGHVGQERWHLAFEVVGGDAPEFFTRSLVPFAVNIGGTEPVAERLLWLAVIQKAIEVGQHLVVQHLLGLIEVHTAADHPRYVLRELIEAAAGFLVAILAGPKGRIVRRAGAPHLVRFADVVSGIAQQQRERWLRAIPHGAAEDRGPARSPEVLARYQCAAARRAAWRGHKRTAEQYAITGDAVEVRRTDHVVDGA